jgi:ABC-type uncharacterized transport system substrate-binding protein
VKRREFITLLGATAPLLGPLAARAQTGAERRLGVLMNGTATDAATKLYVEAFVQELRQLGWIEGRGIRIDIRWNAGDAQLARIYAAQLIGLMPDVILTSSTTNLTVIQQATSTVPVVFVQVSDPVAQGFVASLTKPGGNLTGFSSLEFSIGGKWLDLLKEAVPRLTRVGVMFNPDTSPQSKFFLRSIETAAASLGMQAASIPVRASIEIEPTIESLAHQSGSSLILPTDTFTRLRVDLIAEATIRHRLPAISAYDDFAKGGGLMSYGAVINVIDQFRQAANYVHRILRGAKPSDLPVQQSVKYRLVINLETAKALGLTMPLPLLGRADEVIE